MRKYISLILVIFIVISIVSAAGGCNSKTKEAESWLKKARANFDQRLAQEKELKDLLEKVSFNPKKSKTPKETYQLQKKIANKLNDVKDKNSKYIKNLENAEVLTSGKDLEYIEKELKAAKKKSEAVDVQIKIQEIYLKIWEAMGKEGEIPAKNEYQTFSEKMKTLASKAKKLQKEYDKLKKEAEDYYSKYKK